jgi:prepilin peptidase CpaA
MIALGACLLVGAWSDVRSRRIPNTLTLSGLALALVVRAAWSVHAGSGAPLLSGLGGFAIAFAVSLPLFLVRGLGGGDVKLLAMAGAFLGIEHVVAGLLISAVAGGVMGIWQAVRMRMLASVLRGCRDLVLYCGTLGRAGARPVLESSGAITIPYGVAIAIGSMAGWLV